MPASTRARAAAPKVTLRFWMRSDLDCVHFEQAMGSGWFDGGEHDKKHPAARMPVGTNAGVLAEGKWQEHRVPGD